jgi:hypothetical protein
VQQACSAHWEALPAEWQAVMQEAVPALSRIPLAGQARVRLVRRPVAPWVPAWLALADVDPV